MRFIDDASMIRYQIVDDARCLRVHDRFAVSDVVQFLFFLRFDVALKASRRMLLIAVDAFFMIVNRFVFVEEMIVCAKFAFCVVATNFA